MATETRPTRKRKANPLKLQRESSQKFRVPHEKDTRSPIGAKKKGGKGSARGRGSSVSTGENASPFERRDTVSRIVAEDPFGIRKNYGNVSSRPLQGSDATSKWSDSQAQLKDEYTAEPESDYEAEVRGAEKAIEDIKAMEEREARELISAWDESKTKWDESTDGESDYEAEARGAEKTMEDIKAMEEREAIERMKNWAASTTKWEKKADLYDLPLMSPFTLPGKATQELKVDFDGPPRTSPSTSPSEARDELDARVARIRQRSRILQMQGNVEENHQKQPHPKERDSNHDSQLQSPDSGDALCDDDRVTIEDSGSRSPSNTKESDQDPLPQFPETDHNIDETSNRKNDAVSDLGHESDESGTSSPSPRSSNNKERDILDSQFQPSGPERTLVDASPTNDAVEGQTDPETNRLRVSPETTHSSSILVKTNLVSQPKSPSSDQIKSPDSQPQYPGGGGVTVGKDSAQDEVEEHFDAEAWLNSDSPLPGNYRAIFGDEFQGPEPTNPNLSNDSSSGTDSLVVSPTRSVRLPCLKGLSCCLTYSSRMKRSFLKAELLALLWPARMR